jgi:hypothetical protein
VSGSGPWVLADMEQGMYFSDACMNTNPADTGVTYQFVTAMIKK